MTKRYLFVCGFLACFAAQAQTCQGGVDKDHEFVTPSEAAVAEMKKSLAL